MAEAGLRPVEAAPFREDLADGPAGGRAVWVRTSDGVRIRVAAWEVEGARGTVLLFPGRTEYAEKYGRAARDLADRGFATLAVDWRGQGMADRLLDHPLKGHVGDFSEYQRDVAAVLAAARAMYLPEPWHLVGHSMGGCIGLRALDERLPVVSAAFTGPMWGIGLPGPARPVAWALSSTARALGLGHLYAPGVVKDAYPLITPFEGNALTNDPDMYEYMRHQAATCADFALAGATLGWVHAALRETRALSRLPAPAVPGLTFLGSDETIVDSAAIRDRMQGWPNGRLEVLEGGRHEVLMDTPEMRARIFDAMAAHFDAHSPAADAAQA